MRLTLSGRARIYLCNVNLLDAAMPRNLAQHAAVAAAHHQHRLWLILQLAHTHSHQER